MYIYKLLHFAKAKRNTIKHELCYLILQKISEFYIRNTVFNAIKDYQGYRVAKWWKLRKLEHSLHHVVVVVVVVYS